MNEKMTWISLEDKLPEPGKHILACDWYPPKFSQAWLRIEVCESDPQKVYSYGKLTKKKSFPICDSIGGDDIGFGDSAHWMDLPGRNDKRWVSFIKELYNHQRRESILIRLHNGNHYVAVINSFEWNPNFIMWEDPEGLEAIDCYMSLPQPPLLRNGDTTFPSPHFGDRKKKELMCINKGLENEPTKNY